jgi:hypothetical protein
MFSIRSLRPLSLLSLLMGSNETDPDVLIGGQGCWVVEVVGRWFLTVGVSWASLS